MNPEKQDNNQEDFMCQWGAIFYVPVIGIFFSVTYLALVLFGAKKNSVKHSILLLEGVVYNFLYLTLLYIGVKHRIDFYDSSTLHAEGIKHIGNYVDYGKAMFGYILNRPFVYIELIVVLILKKSPRSKGVWLGFFIWLVIGDFCYVEFEYETLTLHELGIALAALLYWISLPVFISVGSKIGAKAQKKEEPSSAERDAVSGL